MRLVSQNNDVSSIIFDANRCDKMHASYIQLKYMDYETLAQKVMQPDATQNITLYTDNIEPLS